MENHEEHIIRILHVSDLHASAKPEGDAFQRERVLGRAWRENLAQLLDDGRPFDLICFTGDIAQSGKAEEYQQATSFIEEMRQILSVPPQHVFPVPGNHDIDRSVKIEAWQEMREAARATNPRAFSKWLAGGPVPYGATPAWRDNLLARQAAWRNWLAESGRPELVPGDPHLSLGYRVSLKLSGRPFPVHIIGLDTAWLAGDNHDAGKLYLTEDQVGRLTTDPSGKSLPGLRLALAHHPLTDLADSSLSGQYLADGTDLLLRGHLHEEEVARWANPDRTFHQLAAGSLFDTAGGSDWPNGINVVDVVTDAAGRPLRYELWFRSWSDRGFWRDDNGGYRQAHQGRLTWLVESPEKPMKPTGEMKRTSPKPVQVRHAPSGFSLEPETPSQLHDETQLSWLHLSGLCFGADGFRDRILDKLPGDLIRKTGIHPDMVLISGGLAAHGKAEEYQLAEEKLRLLAGKLNHHPGRCWFIVPGPGDVDSTRIKSLHLATRDGINPADTYKILQEHETWTMLSGRLSPFQAFLKSFQGSAAAWPLASPWRVARFEKHGLVVSVLCLNTAWSGQASTKKGQLIGERQLRAALDQTEQRQIKIGLCGHGLDRLEEDEKSMAEGILLGPDGCDFLLWGDPTSIRLAQPQFPGSSCVSMAVGPCHLSQNAPTAILTRISPQQGIGEARAFEYCLGKGGFWRPTEPYADMHQGIWRFSLPGKQHVRGPISRPPEEVIPSSGTREKPTPDDSGTIRRENRFLQNVPVLALDIAGFSHYSPTQKRPILQKLQDIMERAATEADPLGQPDKTWIQHGTGDGYYVFLKNASAEISLNYALAIGAELEVHNQKHPSLTIYLRMVLAIGNVDKIGNQWEGEVLIQAARFLDHKRFKDYLEQARTKDIASVLAMSDELHLTLPPEKTRACVPYVIQDKHQKTHHGHVWDRGFWEEHPAVSSALPRELEAAHEAHAEIKNAGQDPSAIERKILKIKRELREGGQLSAGDILSGRYRLLEEIGKGGFAVVWKAWDRVTQKAVAVKVLHGQYARDRTRRERFFRGARKMAELKHPSIVPVLNDKGEDGGFYYFVMAYLAGGDLHGAVRSGAYDKTSLLRWIATVGDALDFAHQKGMIHRDIKPANIMLDAEGRAYLTDFDLVQAGDTTGGTRTGAGMGSFIYAAPELMANAAKVCPRCDIFGLGMTALFALYGNELPVLAWKDGPGFVRDLPIHTSLHKIIGKAVAWDLEDRTATLAIFCADLRVCLDSGFVERDASSESHLPVQQTRTASSGTAVANGTWLNRKGEDVWVRIPSGSFTMGADDITAREKPPHRVVLSPFLIGRFPVTHQEFKRFLEDGGYNNETYWPKKAWSWRKGKNIQDPAYWNEDSYNDPQQPVVGVSWYEAAAYCRWLTIKARAENPAWWDEDRDIRLATEAEWEFAARGVEGRIYPWGNPKPTKEMANYASKVGKPTRVGAYPEGKTPEGVLDMAGNVWEWCQDSWDSQAYQNRPDESNNPIVEISSSERALRGGSWGDDGGYLRSACRLGSVAGYRGRDFGFRCVCVCVAVPEHGP